MLLCRSTGWQVWNCTFHSGSLLKAIHHLHIHNTLPDIIRSITAMINDTEIKLLLDCNNVQMQVHFPLNHVQKNVILSVLIFRTCVVCGSHSYLGWEKHIRVSIGNERPQKLNSLLKRWAQEWKYKTVLADKIIQQSTFLNFFAQTSAVFPLACTLLFFILSPSSF